MRNLILLCAVVAATPVAGQTAPATSGQTAPVDVTVGAAIVDSTGTSVGTVDQVAGDVVTVNTGTNKVGVPKGNFAVGASGLVLGNTKIQLDTAATQAAAQAQAQVKAALVPGAAVHGTGGMTLGKVKSADDQYVTLTSAKGDVRLPVTGFATGPAGLVVGMTAAEFDAALTAVKAQ